MNQSLAYVNFTLKSPRLKHQQPPMAIIANINKLHDRYSGTIIVFGVSPSKYF